MEVIRCDLASLTEHEEAYRALLTRDDGNLIYASPEFLRFLADVTDAQVGVLLLRAGGETKGALPYAVAGAADTGPVLNSLPWWGSHGGVLLDRRAADADSIRRRLIAALLEEITRIGALSATLVLLPDEEAAREVYEEAYRPDLVEGRIGQFTALPAETSDVEATLLATFRQKTRNLVRKSLKQGFVQLTADEEWAWDFLAATHTENIAVLGGRPKPRSHFAAMRRLPSEMRRLALAMDGDTPVAAMLTLRFNRTVEYVTPAVRVEHRSRQPLSFLIFEAMKAAVAAGDRTWNWGGTWISQSSLHHFKAGFGAVDRPYSYLIKATDHGRSLFRSRRDELGNLFPFFYTYPYALLDDHGS